MRIVKRILERARASESIAHTIRAGLGVLVIAAFAADAGACPTCRSALAEGGAHWAHGFALSIAVLLGVMLAAGGAFGFAVWRATRGMD
jgi:hypothetical protein